MKVSEDFVNKHQETLRLLETPWLLDRVYYSIYMTNYAHNQEVILLILLSVMCLSVFVLVAYSCANGRQKNKYLRNSRKDDEYIKLEPIL